MSFVVPSLITEKALKFQRSKIVFFLKVSELVKGKELRLQSRDLLLFSSHNIYIKLSSCLGAKALCVSLAWEAPSPDNLHSLSSLSFNAVSLEPPM